MVGVADKADLHCPKCKKKTPHETHWEGEAPNELYVVCKVCNTARTIYT